MDLAHHHPCIRLPSIKHLWSDTTMVLPEEAWIIRYIK